MPQLDGVRGLAIFLVLLFHLNEIVQTSGFASVVLSSGWVGVDLFFVLSGFLITRILLATRKDRKYYSRFYIRRALRIWPLYFLYVLGIYMGLHVLSHIDTVRQFAAGSQDMREYMQLSRPLIVYLLFVQNLVGFGDVLGVTWSLCIEEHFYLVWPVVVRRFSIAGLKKLLWASFLMQPLLRVAYAFFARSRHMTFNAYYSPMYHKTFFHLDSIIAGCLLAIYWIDGKRPESLRGVFWKTAAAGFAASLGCIVLIHRENAFGACFAFTALSVFFSGIIGLVLLGWNQAFFRNGLMLYLGTISYGLYLIHFPIFAIFQDHAILAKLFPFRSILLSELAGAVCATTISLAVASASWNWLEKPVLRLKSRLAP